MEKRALLAALLSAVVLVVWYAMFGPAEKRRSGEEPTQVNAVETATPQPVAADEKTPTEATPAEVAPATQAAEAQTVEVHGAGIRALVDTRGGVLRSIVLEGYDDAKGAPLELVREGSVAPLTMAATGPWNEGIYTLEGADGKTVIRWSDGQGNWVEKRLSASGGKYGLNVEVRGGGRPVADGVVVASAIGGAVEQQKGGFARSGAVVAIGGKVKRIDPAKVKGVDTIGGAEFAGMEDQYFLLVLLPDRPLTEARIGAGPGVVAVGSGGEVAGTLYCGPKEHATLVGYGRGLEGTISFGLFGFLSVIFLAAMRWIYSAVGNWGVAIVVLTAAIRLLLFPLTHKSTVAMRKMQALQPKMKAIQERYKEKAKRDPQVRQRMNQEVMQLYKQEGVNPMGGCLPTLVQLPILWGLYTMFAYAIELRHAPFMLWIHDLSAKDPTYITPILMTVSMVVQQKMAPQAGDPSQRRMFMLLPFVFGFMFMNFPSGLVLYWLVNNLLTIGQQAATERLLRTRPAA